MSGYTFKRVETPFVDLHLETSDQLDERMNGLKWLLEQEDHQGFSDEVIVENLNEVLNEQVRRRLR